MKQAEEKGSFIPVNTAATPESLFESYILVIEKARLRMPKRTIKGYFEASEGGTIFLDEIGDLDLRFQPKLLRVIQRERNTNNWRYQTKKC